MRLPSVSKLDKPAASGEEGARQGLSGDDAQPGQAAPRPGQDLTDPVEVVQKSGPQIAPKEMPLVLGHEAAVLAKEVAKHLKTGDQTPDAAVLQTAETRFAGSRIEMSRMDQAPNAGLYYHDPAEIAETLRERFQSAGGRHLVLEVEPEEFGKMSIRVGAKTRRNCGSNWRTRGCTLENSRLTWAGKKQAGETARSGKSRKARTRTIPRR